MPPDFDLRSLTVEKLADEQLAKALEGALRTVRRKSGEAMDDLADSEAVRDLAGKIRYENVNELRANLELFAERAEAGGSRVLWASTAGEARKLVAGIAKEHGVVKAVLSKSMLGEEIEVEQALRGAGVSAVQTDLGERVVQLAREKPSHITAPCLHMSAAQVAKVLSRTTGMEYTSDPAGICRQLAESMRPVFLAGHLGLSGANLAIADSGRLVMVENEGNVRLGYTLPDVHVVLVGIEKMVSTAAEAAVLLSLLPRMATGQAASSYVSLLSPQPIPGQTRYLVLVDAGRSDVFNAGPHRDLLKCIRCGACMNVCPVYEKVGGHAYRWTYPGPIGIALAPFMAPPEIGARVVDLCSLCGACTEACPVRIPLDRLIVLARAVAAGLKPPAEVARERKALRWYSRAMKGRLAYRWSHWGHRLMTRRFPDRLHRLVDRLGWAGPRTAPLPAPTLFRKLKRGSDGGE